MTYGIKIAKPGKSVYSTDMRDLSVDMNTFSIFKLHSNSTTSVTLNGGDSEKSTTVSHDLGYVPAFLVYYKRSDESVERLLPDIPFGVDFDFYPWAYATTTGITVGYSFKTPYNQFIADTFNTSHNDSAVNPTVWIGYSSGNTHNSGIQYTAVTLNQGENISNATLDFLVGDKGANSSDVKINIWGISVDNLSDFGSDLGQTKTTATHSQNIASVGIGSTFGISVTNELKEIIARPGWSSGNALGFYLFDNGTSSAANNYYSTYPSNTIKLTVTRPGSLTVSFRVIIFKDKIAD